MLFLSTLKRYVSLLIIKEIPKETNAECTKSATQAQMPKGKPSHSRLCQLLMLKTSIDMHQQLMLMQNSSYHMFNANLTL